MQSFTLFLSFAAVLVAVAAAPENILDSLNEPTINYNAPSTELLRLRKSAYGGSAPAPPCPKSYLFSCQSNVASVPCSPPPAPAYAPAPAPSYAPAPAPSYAPAPAPAYHKPAPAPAKPSYSGAYSVPVPSYSLPQMAAAYPGIPQELLRPVYGYNQQYYY